jgi:hypothetical protein
MQHAAVIITTILFSIMVATRLLLQLTFSKQLNHQLRHLWLLQQRCPVRFLQPHEQRQLASRSAHTDRRYPLLLMLKRQVMLAEI